ncbi:MAG TPA: DNA double-strand break repair nuclease NurA [Nitrososphaera sp.]|nr:DNA double-strand break repair nuclease NurA [Nitrososphaera sp.]
MGQPFSSLSLGDLGVIESVSKCLAPKLDELRGRRIIFSRDDKKLVPHDGWGLKAGQYCGTVTTFRPISENRIVAAVDSSCTKLAETEEGSLYAVKCGIATAIGGRALMHFRIGPFLFYLSESSVRDSELDDRLAKAVLLDDDMAKRLVRVRTERAVQDELAGHLVGSTILVDGSLRASVFEDSQRSIKKISEECVLRRNTLVGISKATRFKPLERASGPLLKVPGPAYIDVDVIVKSLVRNSAGTNLLVRLDGAGPVLRADVVGGSAGESLGRLIGNDPISSGYPETLRLAHHISTFTGTEITCLRSHVLNNYDVTELAADDIRRTLLGSISV